MTSDLSVGSVDGEGMGVLVARGDDGPPQMEGASGRSLLPVLRLQDKRETLRGTNDGSIVTTY